MTHGYVGFVDVLAFARHVDCEAEPTVLATIQHLTVSSDGTALGVADASNTMFVIPLDVYFRLYPEHMAEMEPPSDDDSDNEDETVSNDKTVVFGCVSWRHVLRGRNIVQPRHLHPYEKLHWYRWAVESSALRQSTSMVSPWKYNPVRAVELLSPTSHAAVLPVIFRCSNTDEQITHMLLTADSLVAVMSSSIVSFERATKTAVVFDISASRMQPVVLVDQSLLALGDAKLHLPLRNSSVNDFLDQVIMSDGPEYE